MHVLTRGGAELATFYGPVCQTSDNTCRCAQLVGVDSNLTVEVATISDRDLSTEDLEQACLRYLQRTGWHQVNPEQARELAADITDVASQWEVGDLILARYDHATEEWTFTEIEPADTGA